MDRHAIAPISTGEINMSLHKYWMPGFSRAATFRQAPDALRQILVQGNLYDFQR